MKRISYTDAGLGLYSCGTLARDLACLGRELGRIDCRDKIQAIARNMFPLMLSAVASLSSLLLWTHSVGILSITRHLRLVKTICYSSYTLLYGDAASTYRQHPEVWTLAGNVSFLGWSLLSLTGSQAPLLSLLLRAEGVAAFTISYLQKYYAL